MRLAAAFAMFAAPAAAEPVVLASLASDLNGDGRAELAVLVGESDMTLAIFEQKEDYGPLLLAAQGPAIAWMGSLNEPPVLEVTPSGSLRVQSSNWGIGRHKWEMSLTIAFRRDAYRVAGVTFGEVDTLTPDSARQCDVNLLTGKGRITAMGGGETGTEIASALDAIPIQDWPENGVQLACGPDW